MEFIADNSKLKNLIGPDEQLIAFTAYIETTAYFSKYEIQLKGGSYTDYTIVKTIYDRVPDEYTLSDGNIYYKLTGLTNSTTYNAKVVVYLQDGSDISTDSDYTFTTLSGTDKYTYTIKPELFYTVENISNNYNTYNVKLGIMNEIKNNIVVKYNLDDLLKIPVSINSATLSFTADTTNNNVGALSPIISLLYFNEPISNYRGYMELPKATNSKASPVTLTGTITDISYTITDWFTEFVKGNKSNNGFYLSELVTSTTDWSIELLSSIITITYDTTDDIIIYNPNKNDLYPEITFTYNTSSTAILKSIEIINKSTTDKMKLVLDEIDSATYPIDIIKIDGPTRNVFRNDININYLIKQDADYLSKFIKLRPGVNVISIQPEKETGLGNINVDIEYQEIII